MSQLNMNKMTQSHEALSALVDGEADVIGLRTVSDQWLSDNSLRVKWQVYHLIGSTLRSEQLVSSQLAAQEEFLVQLRARLAAGEQPHYAKSAFESVLQTKSIVERIKILYTSLQQSLRVSGSSWKTLPRMGALASVLAISFLIGFDRQSESGWLGASSFDQAVALSSAGTGSADLQMVALRDIDASGGANDLMLRLPISGRNDLLSVEHRKGASAEGGYYLLTTDQHLSGAPIGLDDTSTSDGLSLLEERTAISKHR